MGANNIYLEYKKKNKALREMLERSVIDRGEYPDKNYITQLLNDIDMRLSVFKYDKVSPDTKLDVQKMNKDTHSIYKDLEILYEIVTELEGQKYKELEAYVNGYLLTLENIADMADKKAREDIESTSLGAKVICFKSSLPEVSFDNSIATIKLGDITCDGCSKIYGTISGRGFLQSSVVFDFGAGEHQKVLPYAVNRDMVQLGGKIKKVSYTYTMPKSYSYGAAFKIANASIKVDPSHKYEAYGGANMLRKTTANSDGLVRFLNASSYETGETTQYSFYLTNATKIRFDFSEEPVSRNFSEDDIMGLRRDKVYYYELTLKRDASFNIETNGIMYAKKEKLSINGHELYISGYTRATDFLINEYEPAAPVVLKDVKVRIYGVNENAFRIDSIAVKEIPETGAIS